MNEPIYLSVHLGSGVFRVKGPGLPDFDPFAFVAVGPEERARLLKKLLNDAYRQGYEAAKKEAAK